MIKKIARACLLVSSLGILSGHSMEPQAKRQEMKAADIASYVDELASTAKPAMMLPSDVKTAIVENANLLLQHSYDAATTKTILKALFEISDKYAIPGTCIELDELVKLVFPQCEDEYYMTSLKRRRSNMIQQLLEFKPSTITVALNFRFLYTKLNNAGMNQGNKIDVFNALMRKNTPGKIVTFTVAIEKNFHLFFLEGMNSYELCTALLSFIGLDEETHIHPFIAFLQVASIQREVLMRTLPSNKGPQ